MPFKTKGTVLGCLLSFSVAAGTMGTAQEAYRPWSLVGSLGYTQYDKAYDGGSADPFAQNAIGDGQTAFGRFAVARQLGHAYSGFQLGAEVGVQSGNTIRLNIPELTLFPFGGMIPQASIKPMLDLLGTVSYQPDNMPAFGIVKLGVAYRRMQINDRVTFNDLQQAALEVQGGIGMQISSRAKLSLNYQGVFNGNTTYTLDPFLFVGHISNIPNQNGVLLSLAYTV